MRKNINYPTLPLLSAILITSLLGACATPYQERSSTRGGYQQTTVTANIERIEFFGNSRVSEEQVSNYTLFRCAEYAREKKRPYFLIYNSLTDVATNRKSAAPQVTHTGKDLHSVAYLYLLDIEKPESFGTEYIYNRLNPEHQQ